MMINNNMTNIIDFPLDRVTPPPLLSLSEEQRHEIAEMYIDIYTEVMLENLHNEGFDLDSEYLITDITISMEILKSALLRELNLKHPLHDIQEKLYSLME